jgi:hypothetical protein
MLNPLCCGWEHRPANNRRAQRFRDNRAFPHRGTDVCQGHFKLARQLEKTAGHPAALPIGAPNRAATNADSGTRRGQSARAARSFKTTGQLRDGPNATAKCQFNLDQ